MLMANWWISGCNKVAESEKDLGYRKVAENLTSQLTYWEFLCSFDRLFKVKYHLAKRDDDDIKYTSLLSVHNVIVIGSIATYDLVKMVIW